MKVVLVRIRKDVRAVVSIVYNVYDAKLKNGKYTIPSIDLHYPHTITWDGFSAKKNEFIKVLGNAWCVDWTSLYNFVEVSVWYRRNKFAKARAMESIVNSFSETFGLNKKEKEVFAEQVKMLLKYKR